MTTALCLASASPRRRQLLSAAGFEFSVTPADLDERRLDGESPLVMTGRLAWQKAAAVSSRAATGAVVLAADTTVVCAGAVLGKPADPAEARSMLSRLAGRTHRVLTCWAIMIAVDESHDGGEAATGGVTSSLVRMRELGGREIADYVATGEPLDKAGAYAVQGEGRRLVGAVVGSRDNVIGLPVAQVAAALARFGVLPRERPDEIRR